MRLIDGDALIEDVDGDLLDSIAEHKAIEKIMNAPTIEFEIIHCKDCKHWSRESICDGFCSEDCMRHDEEFYCGYAERRTDNDN